MVEYDAPFPHGGKRRVIPDGTPIGPIRDFGIAYGWREGPFCWVSVPSIYAEIQQAPSHDPNGLSLISDYRVVNILCGSIAFCE